MKTVTSADAALGAVPAKIVTCPAARAVRIGGSPVDRLTTFGLPDVQVNPVTGWPAAPSAFANCAVGYCPGFPHVCTRITDVFALGLSLLPDLGREGDVYRCSRTPSKGSKIMTYSTS